MSKYRNVRADGFDSIRERKRYADLLLLQRAGEISGLERQVKYVLIGAQYRDGKCKARAITWTADFRYTDKEGRQIVEDSKGYPNDRWPMKKAMMLYFHNIEVQEV